MGSIVASGHTLHNQLNCSTAACITVRSLSVTWVTSYLLLLPFVLIACYQEDIPVEVASLCKGTH